MLERVEMDEETQRAFARDALPWIENVRRFALSLCHDPADADDLVQDTYLRAFRSWHTFEAGTDCRRWLFTICRNVFRRRLRDRARAMNLQATEVLVSRAEASDVAVYAAAAGGVYDDIFTRMDVEAALMEALEVLPEPYRSTLILVHVEDQTYETAAEILGVPVGTVRSRLFRARRIMQQHLLAVARDAGVVGAAGVAEELPSDAAVVPIAAAAVRASDDPTDEPDGSPAIVRRRCA